MHTHTSGQTRHNLRWSAGDVSGLTACCAAPCCLAAATAAAVATPGALPATRRASSLSSTRLTRSSFMVSRSSSMAIVCKQGGTCGAELPASLP